MIFINVELSRQVLVLLLDHNQHAWERVRKRERDRERCEDVKREREEGRENETDGEGEWGWGRFFGGVSHCELSAVIILLRHLRQGMPHPSAHASVAHGNCRVVYVCVSVCMCLYVLCRTLEVMRCTHMHVSPGYGAVELWLPQHLID